MRHTRRPMSKVQPLLGATVQSLGTAFRVWAPQARTVDVVLERTGDPAIRHPMRLCDGYFCATIDEARPGDLYRYSIDGREPLPDPASRFQPHGVHGPSQIVDPTIYSWSDANWAGLPAEDLIFYELHVGTFSPEGTLRSAAQKLPELQTLGITAVELMPLSDFAGNRNWGYDGVCPFAPARCYGTPDELREFVNTAHGLGLAVFLDVVYNHLGPDGAYQHEFSPYYISTTHRSPWGDALNFDGPFSDGVRDYCIENAVRWTLEYHFDGLRLDATHAIVDDSPRHILTEISSAVHAAVGPERHVHVIAEDVRNLAAMVKAESHGGWGLDALWSDDFHHQMRRCLAGDCDGYYRDFAGTAEDIATTAREGWFYRGQDSSYFGKPRGSDPADLSYSQFVFFIQNHDQVGNRAFGDRIHHRIDMASYRAASTLLLLLPESPLLFMGQEWAASTPFQFFTDHNADLGRLVTAGRRREFERFAEFSDPQKAAMIPDPQAIGTFEASRLQWSECERDPHRSILRLYQELLRLRRSVPALRSSRKSGNLKVEPAGDHSLVIRRDCYTSSVLGIVRLHGQGPVNLSGHPFAAGSWRVLLDTEDGAYAQDCHPAVIDTAQPQVTFARPGAVLLRAARGDGS